MGVRDAGIPAGTSPGDLQRMAGSATEERTHSAASHLCFQLGGVMGDGPGMSWKKVILHVVSGTVLLLSSSLLCPGTRTKALADPGRGRARGTAERAHRLRLPS